MINLKISKPIQNISLTKFKSLCLIGLLPYAHVTYELYTTLPVQRGKQPPRDHLLLKKPEHTGCL